MDMMQIVVLVLSTAVTTATATIIGNIFSNKSNREKLLAQLDVSSQLKDVEIENLKREVNNLKTLVSTTSENSRKETSLEIGYLKEDMEKIHKTVESHNNYARMFAENVPLINEKIKVVNNRLEDLEAGQKELTERLLSSK